MKLLTEAIKKKLPPLYSQEDKKPEEVRIHCKFFHPYSNWTWYCTEYRPEEEGLFFGYVVGLESEYGYFSLAELEEVGTIERDIHWDDKTTLAQVI